jgi:predicted Na+-dependent transporter
MAINALTMVLGPFLIPPSMALLAGADVTISAWGMFQQLAVILLLPLVLGVGLRWLADRRWNTKPLLPLLPALSALTAVLLMFTVTNVNTPLILAGNVLTPGLLIAVILIFPIGFLLPYWAGRYAFAWQQRVAVTYASGMKNLPIAVGLAFTSFPGQ